LFLEYDGTTGANAKLWINQSDTGSGTVWTEMSSDALLTLQDAYDNGQTIDLADSAGDMVITLDEVATVANFAIISPTGSYLVADASAKKIVLGSDTPTDITVDIAATVSMTNAAPLITAASKNIDLTTTVSGDININAVGELDLDGGTSVVVDSGTTMTLNAGSDLALNAGGSAGDTITLTADSAGAVYSILLQATTSGGVKLDGFDGVTIEGNGNTVDINTTSTIDLNATGTGKVEINAGGASWFTVAGNSLDLTTTTSGDVNVSAAAELDLDGGTTVVMNSVAVTTITGGTGIAITSTANDVDITGAGNITVTTDTAGNNETMMLLTGSDDPTSVAKDASRGSLYLRDDTSEGTLFIKQDDGSTTAWDQVATLISSVSTIIKLTAGGIFVAGDAVYIDSSGDAVATDADVPASSVAIGFAIDAAPIGNETDRRIQLAGEASVSSTLTTLGVPVFLDVTAGAVTQTAPVAVGDTVLKMGIVTATGAGTSKVIIQIGESSLN
jgi:hypothetical protein